MTKKTFLALVTGNPGTFQNGLLALITTFPQISSVIVAEEIESALRMMEIHNPKVVIMDTTFPNVGEVIKEIKTNWPHIFLIVLAESNSEEIEAEAKGADTVLLKGFSPRILIEIIEKFIENYNDSLI